jgi:hypothetical protein
VTSRRILLACGLALVLAAACTAPAPPPVPMPASLAWTEATLPMPPGTPGRLAVLDAADCDGIWYVVGGVLGAGDATRPAAWTSADGRTWRTVTFMPLPGSYYGPEDLIYSVACAGGRVAGIGARSGGAHGNPRVSTWRTLADGRFAEVSAAFETYGGDSAVNVARLAAGPSGFVIAGNRTSGAAVWLSRDGASFRLFEGAPGLASDANHRTAASDAVAGTGGQWVIVGGSAATGSADQEPAMWVTRDGSRFTRVDVPFDPGYNELQRAIRIGDDIVAVGPRGQTIGAWRGPASALSRSGSTIAQEGTFGQAADGVQALAAAGGRLIAASGAGLWLSADRGATWRPLRAPAGAGRSMAVAGRAGMVLLAAAGRVWTAPG